LATGLEYTLLDISFAMGYMKVERDVIHLLYKDISQKKRENLPVSEIIVNS